MFAVMALARRHTFLVLTKRAKRMREYLMPGRGLKDRIDEASEEHGAHHADLTGRWPLPNVWLGVSCEDQATADERITLLLQTPAAVRFVSAEPLLSGIDLTEIITSCGGGMRHQLDALRGRGIYLGAQAQPGWGREPHLDWVIVGGESGPGARPCDVAWIRSIVERCREAKVACFTKQLGAHVLARSWDDFGPQDYRAYEDECAGEALPREGVRLHLRDSKGGDPAEWCEDLRVREFPR